jgi:hypothetical protein
MGFKEYEWNMSFFGSWAEQDVRVFTDVGVGVTWAARS